MANRFKKKVAVITGAAQGIGKRVANAGGRVRWKSADEKLQIAATGIHDESDAAKTEKRSECAGEVGIFLCGGTNRRDVFAVGLELSDSEADGSGERTCPVSQPDSTTGPIDR